MGYDPVMAPEWGGVLMRPVLELDGCGVVGGGGGRGLMPRTDSVDTSCHRARQRGWKLTGM